MDKIEKFEKYELKATPLDEIEIILIFLFLTYRISMNYHT